MQEKFNVITTCPNGHENEVIDVIFDNQEEFIIIHCERCNSNYGIWLKQESRLVAIKNSAPEWV